MNKKFDDIAADISRATGSRFTVKQSRNISGGDISEAFELGDGSRRYFVKLQPASGHALFEAEAAGLESLAAAHAVRVPEVVCHGVSDTGAYLVLEYLSLKPDGDAAQLGRLLAQQHRVSAPQFGGPHNNWIGATPQPNGWHDTWPSFWRQRRLQFQLGLAASNGYTGALQSDGEFLMAHLDAFFAGYRPVASLLHGDLWGGNHGYMDSGQPVVFDPAVYFGDRECDLAMTELFGGFAPAFHAAYREAWPLDTGYALRKSLYNWYHILNHANLFGGGYVAQATRMAAQLRSHIR